MNDEYHERHHIIPKSIGGSDNGENLVLMTARQHYIAHMLLVKIAESHNDLAEYRKMLYAFNGMKWGRMNNERAFRYNSRLYQKLKEQYAEMRIVMMQTTNPMCGKMWICNFELEESKVWNSNEPIPDGWIKGRHSKSQFKKIKNGVARLQKEVKLLKEEKHKFRDLAKQEKLLKLQLKKQEYQKQQQKKIDLLYDMFKEFNKNGFEGVVTKFGYRHTRNNLIMAFKANIPEYVPQVCNRWKNKK